MSFCAEPPGCEDPPPASPPHARGLLPPPTLGLQVTPRACRDGELARMISVLWLRLSRLEMRTRNVKRERCLDHKNGFMRPSLVFASQLRRERQNQPPPASPQHTLCSQLMAWEGFFLSSCHVSAAQPMAVGCSEEAFSSMSCPSASPPKNQQPTRGHTLMHFPPHRPPSFPGCTLTVSVFPGGCRSPCVTQEHMSQKERGHFTSTAGAKLRTGRVCSVKNSSVGWERQQQCLQLRKAGGVEIRPRSYKAGAQMGNAVLCH